jgi:O-antigen ligase
MPPPDATLGATREQHPRYSGTRVGLVGAAFLAPFSATHLVGPLTVGRTAVLLFAALLLFDLLRHRPRITQIDLPALLLVAGYIGVSAWILLNMSAIGCNCYGKAGGFLEFASIGVLALIALAVEQRLRGPALQAIMAGTALAAVLALLGVGALNSGTVDLTQTGGRLSGTYGNANELGFALALALPIGVTLFLSAGTRLSRFLLASTVVLLAVALAATYSRGSIITAGVGIATIAFWEVRGSRRGLVIATAATATAVALGAGFYSFFQHSREDASFEAVPVALRGLGTRDLSGWDSRAKGPLSAGPSRLTRSADGIEIHARHAGEGASIRWGEAEAGGHYVLRLRVRSKGNDGRVGFALGDSLRPGAIVRSTAKADPRWRSQALQWHPERRAPHANLYLWAVSGPLTFEVADVRIVATTPSGGKRVLTMPHHLRGSIYGHLTSVAERAERRYLHSRLDASREALHAFASAPLWGIGWQTFPAYTDERLHYGPLAAHNQYLAIAAELGLIGLALAAVLLVALGLGVLRNGRSEPDPAPLALLAGAVVGVIFVEALPVPQLSIPLAIAAAIICRPRLGANAERPKTREPTRSPQSRR